MAKVPPAAFWLRRARLLAFAVNLAWFWQRLLPALVVLNLLLAAGLLILRQSGNAASAALPPYLGALCLCAVYALVRLRGKRYAVQDALLRIETALGLHNRLTCAREGIAQWPEPIAFGNRVLRLRPRAALLPLLYSAAFIFAALWLPVRTAQAGGAWADTVEPAAWMQVADWTELLREEMLVAEPPVQAFEERLSQLRDRPPEDWYQQGSLEAGEALRDDILLSMQELARQLQAASALLEHLPLQERLNASHGAAAEQLEEQWRKLLQQMQNGELALDPQTQNQLQSLSFAQMNSLSPDQLQAMQEQLRQGAQAMGAAAGLSELDLEAVSLQIAEASPTEAGRGPGPAPLTIKPEGTALQTSRQDGVSNLEMRNPVLGETVGIASRPGNDPQETPFEAAVPTDAAAAQAQGGNVVWQESYTPQERAILEHYFK